MPGLVAFGRRWSVGSDDLFLPSISLFFLHIICLSVSITGLVIDYEKLKDPSSSQSCSSYLYHQLISAIIILSCGFILTICLTVVSLRGSILNDAPRKSAPYLIYILLIVLLLKLTWSGFAVAWINQFYIICTVAVTKQIILGLIICTWLVLLSVITTAWCTYDGAGRSWIKMKRYNANRKEFEMKYPTYRRSGSGNRNWRQRKVIRAYQDSWNHRCRLLFCCIHRNERNRDSFADLARLLSEFFRDLDVVPSDVVVALVLLRRLQRLEQCSIVKQKRNTTYEFLSGVAITSRTKFVAMNDPKDFGIFRNVVHYMHYACAAYGWPWFLIPNGLRGVCNLCSNLRCCCCKRSDLEGVVLEDNCCFCNYAVIPSTFDPGTFDVIYATYHVDVGETPFFVVVDYEKKSVVVSIRGTLSLKDVLTDLNAEGETLPVDPPREDWIGHKGIVAAAVYMKSKLIGEKIIDKAFNKCPERGTQNYRLVLVGHSLGAGTAAILAVLLREKYTTLQCYAFSPPGGLLSMPVVEYTKGFVISVIVGKDLVPRIGLSQMEVLRTDLINAMKKSTKPKWQTLMSGMACCCCIKPEFAMPQRLSSAPSIQSEEFMRTRRSLKDLREVTINPNESAISLTVHQPLYPPGRIMHIVRHHPKKDEIKYESCWRRLLKKEPVFQALWTENTDYGQVLISPGMIDDHMPHQVLRALHRVVTSHGPAKPQRNLTASASPLILSRESLLDETHPSQYTVSHLPNVSSAPGICMETSFSSVITVPTNKHSSECCSLMSPSTKILDADADTDAGNDEEDEATPTNGDKGFHELISSLNLSWNYIANLQDKYMKQETLLHHIRPEHFPPCLPFPYNNEKMSSIGNTSSSGSIISEDAGSTFKEIFGSAKYQEEWMAPLASPETLSEISSLSSRASFFLPKDQSPLLKMKNGGRHSNSSSLHRQHGGFHKSSFNGNGLHNRSFSCTYPENGTEVSVIECSLHYAPKGPKNPSNKSNGEHANSGTKRNRPSNFDISSSDPDPHLQETSTFNASIDSKNPNSIDDSSSKRINGEAKRVSFNLKRKYASKDSGCGLSDSSFATTPAGRPFDPTYPIFSHQEEYGPGHRHPHQYSYQSESYSAVSPVDSPGVVFASSNCASVINGNGASCSNANDTEERFTFSDLNPSHLDESNIETHH